MTSRVASFRSSDSVIALFFAKRARSRAITSDARLASRIVRRTVSRAPSTFGGSAASIRRQVLAFVTMPDSGWLTSFSEYREVFRMHASFHHLHGHRNGRIKLKDTVQLFRPRSLACHCIPQEAARRTETLHFREKCFTALQRSVTLRTFDHNSRD